MRLQIWCQVLGSVTLCFWCPFCIWLSEKQMQKKCRNVRNSLTLNPCGCNLFNFFVQKSSHFLSLYFRSSLPMLVSYNCSNNVNFVCLLKLWPGNQKCWSTWSGFCLFTTFRWLFSLKLKVVSDLPVYFLLHITHSARYFRHLLLQLSLLCILYVFCMWLYF